MHLDQRSLNVQSLGDSGCEPKKDESTMKHRLQHRAKQRKTLTIALNSTSRHFLKNPNYRLGSWDSMSAYASLNLCNAELAQGRIHRNFRVIGSSSTVFLWRSVSTPQRWRFLHDFNVHNIFDPLLDAEAGVDAEPGEWVFKAFLSLRENKVLWAT